MTPFEGAVALLSWAAVAVVAASGALSASRKQLDPVGFILIACVTAFGGGTARDLMLGVPVFWLTAPGMVLLASGIALLVFFTAHLVERRFNALLWADAVGLGIFAVLGAEAAQRWGAPPWVAILMGTITATFGGVLRDIICATAAAFGALVFVVLTEADMPRNLALPIGAFAGFALRGAAILRGWSMPTYRARPGRDYPDQR
jgi:uncharacterized membrane protein YeiH